MSGARVVFGWGRSTLQTHVTLGHRWFWGGTAADRLTPGAACAGKAYFVSNGEPLPLAEITNGILAAAGLPPVTKRIPVPLAIALGGLAELVYAADCASGASHR